MSEPEMLEASEVEKHYGRIVALTGVGFGVRAGELVGLLGPNGAGKSTFVKIACGLTRPSSGTVSVAGASPGSPRANRAIGYLAELFRFPPWLSAQEVLALHQRLISSTGGAQERTTLLSAVGLADVAGRRVGSMSKGMQQRLGLAQALLGQPKLLILDEPTSALDPVGRRLVRELLLDLKSRGMAILLNSHLLGEVERVCDRFVIITKGAVVAEGTAAQLGSALGVEIETSSGIHRYATATRDAIPGLVAELVRSGEEVYRVTPASSSLEDAYLRAVGGETS